MCGVCMKVNKRRIFLIFFDILCFAFVAATCFFVFAASLDKVSVSDSGDYAISSLVLCVFMLFSRLLFGVYTTLWRYTSTQAYFRIILSDIVGSFAAIIVTEFFRVLKNSENWKLFYFLKVFFSFKILILIFRVL